ncbi:MAG: caspase family protein [Polyangiales bacterium]
MQDPNAPQERAPSRLHALLIGIDAYKSVNSLSGCVNDIDAVQRLLVDRLRVPAKDIRRLAAPRTPQPGDPPRPADVPTEPPTRANILAALRALASDAVAPGDRVFIYYSGHGTQRKVVTPDGHFLREALIPCDDRVVDADGEREQYVFDWELNTLLGKIADRTPSVTAVLDACNSAGATREVPARGAKDRFAPSPDAPYALPADVAPPPAPAKGERGVALGFGGGARCMVVAACLDNERARESDDADDDTAHGELTRALLAQLAALAEAELHGLSWARIWRPLFAAVSAANPSQHPWLSDGPMRLVFGGPPVNGDAGYGVAAEGAGYRLDAGALSGVTEGAEVAVYPAAPARLPPLGTPEDLALRLGVLKVTSAEPASARARALTSLPALRGGERGRLVKAGDAARLRLAIGEPAPSIEAELRKSPFVEVLPPGVKGDVTLARRADGDRAFVDDVFGDGGKDDEPAFPPLPSGDPVAVRRFVEHYHRYAAPLRLARGCTDLPQALRVSVLDCNGLKAAVPADKAQDPGLPEVGRRRGSAYVFNASEKKGDMYCIRVDNTSTQDLVVTLFNCEDSGKVRSYADRVAVRGGGHAVIWWPGLLGTPIRATLEPGRRLGVDRLVAVGATNAAASFLHMQMIDQFDTFQAAVRGLRGGSAAFGEPTELWTAALAVLRLEAVPDGA